MVYKFLIYKTKLERTCARMSMTRLLCFTLITASAGFAFEKPGQDASRQTKSLPEIDYSKVKPIEESKSEAMPVNPLMMGVPAPTPADNAMGQGDMLPWLGVLGDPISDAMKAQLELEHGLILKYVAPGSPADKAGLEMYDIIYSLDGQPVSNQLQLKRLITGQRVANCVKLKVHSKGESVLKEVKLCKKPHKENGIKNSSPQRRDHQLSELRRLMEEGRQRVELPGGDQKKGGVGRMFGKILKEVAPDFDLNFETTSSVIIQDTEGSVEIQTINNSKSVIVKDSESQVEFEGAWNTKEDFKKAPQNIKERIDKVSLRGIFKKSVQNEIR